mmetsp:Transcript_19022/g.54029  ORF Transcript_19022/g.54029 Transcript_19022/m.54029 type:complete len:205 (-) Transcript_19022:21-635(-)
MVSSAVSECDTVNCFFSASIWMAVLSVAYPSFRFGCEPSRSYCGVKERLPPNVSIDLESWTPEMETVFPLISAFPNNRTFVSMASMDISKPTVSGSGVTRSPRREISILSPMDFLTFAHILVGGRDSAFSIVASNPASTSNPLTSMGPVPHRTRGMMSAKTSPPGSPPALTPTVTTGGCTPAAAGSTANNEAKEKSVTQIFIFV